MNREDIIRMAQEADEYADKHTPQYVTVPNEWQELRDERFAGLVATAEREACAKVCEARANEEIGMAYEGIALDCAVAIRARSNP